METLLWIVHVLVALTLIGLVLLQHGKGADMGAAFGSGSSGSLFGSSGSANFLSRTTAVLAVMFFTTSLSLTYLSNHKTESAAGVMATHSETAEADKAPAPPVDNSTAPAAPSVDSSKAKDIPK